MKKRIIAFAALFIISAAFGGCTENPDSDSGQSTQPVQTETSVASEQASDMSTTAETEETTTVTPKTTVTATTAETEPSETAAAGLEPKMPEAIIPAEVVKIDVEGPYGGAKYDVNYTVLDGENILILYEFKVGRDISAKAKIFGVSDGKEKLSVDIPHTEADEFFIRDGSYFDDENILCRIFSCKEEKYSYGYDYSTLLATTIYTDYSVKPDDDRYGWRSHIHELPGGRKISISEYGNIREVGSGDLLLNAVYEGPDSKSNVCYRYKFAIDENRFVYDMLGWEWIWGIGVYDFTTGEARDVPDTYDHHPMGYHNGKIYSYNSYYDDSDNIIYVTDINTLEIKPLFELDEHNMVYDYEMTSDGRFFVNTEYSPKNHTFKVILRSTDTFEIAKEYVFENIFEEPCCTNITDIGAVTVSSDEKYIYILDFSRAATAETPEAVTGEAVSVVNPILPPEAKPIYNILMANPDIIFADSVDGITLIDLDFDGTPELLVSKYWFDNGIDWYDFDDVDIYAIDLENECLNYIDTIYTNKRENVLGLKYTDTLERKWFLMSRDTVGSKEFYNSSDYLITLKDGKLHYEEIFGYRFTRFKEGSDVPIIDPYFMGEKIDPSSEKWGFFSEEDMDKWDIADGMHKQYCSDINIVYGLCSDWLAGEENSTAPIKIDDVSARSEIEKMTAHYYWEATPNTALIQYEY